MRKIVHSAITTLTHTRNLRLLLITALLVISYLAFTPLSTPGVEELNDKMAHILAFLILAFLVDFSWPQSPWRLAKIIPLFGYGLFIEVVQSTLPHRMFSLGDIAADALGLVFYSLLLPLLLRNPVLRSLRHKTPHWE